VKILDFGLSRLLTQSLTSYSERPPAQFPREDASTVVSTAVGVLIGTPDYLAPEQVTLAGKPDPRSDIYSLGCTFYHLLTTQVPYPGRSMQDKLLAHQHEFPKPIGTYRSDVPSEVTAIIDRLMAKRPEDRYQTAREVAETLERFLPRSTELDATPISFRERETGRTDSPRLERNWARRFRWLFRAWAWVFPPLEFGEGKRFTKLFSGGKDDRKT
jgi:serine/threonine protein kinase